MTKGDGKRLYTMRLYKRTIEAIEQMGDKPSRSQADKLAFAMDIYTAICGVVHKHSELKKETEQKARKVQLNVRINENVRAELRRKANGKSLEFVEQAIIEKLAKEARQ